MNNDWRYSKERMELRGKALNRLLSKFGGELDGNGEPKYSSQSIYECAHDWVSQGNVDLFEIINYYNTHYS